MEQKHLTPAMVRIIQAYLEDPETPLFATELMKAANVGSGSLYPALTRMEAEGWIVQEIEDIDPKKEGRPARHYFRMTGKGALEAHQALVELSDSVRPPAKSPAWLPGWQPSFRATTALQCLTGMLRPAPKGI
ncbi:PadR family transcriptional regulator [Streptomyces massasporeus]